MLDNYYELWCLLVTFNLDTSTAYYDAYKWSMTIRRWIMLPTSDLRQFYYEIWCIQVI